MTTKTYKEATAVLSGRQSEDKTIIRFPTVQRKTGLSRTTLWRRVKDGSFPEPVKISARTIGWFSDEIQDWCTSRPRVIPEKG